jgi:hypothetical protein
MWNNYGCVFETMLFENEATHVVAISPPVKFELLRGEYTIWTRSYGRVILPLKGEVGEERQIPRLPPIHTDATKTYLVVTARTKDPRESAERDCAAQVDRAITLAGLFMNPFIFARPLYRGWLGDDPQQFDDATVLFTPYQHFKPAVLEKNLKVARAVLAGDADVNRRFTLMARLFNRAATLDRPDETFLWLWTCLEVFPMADTSKIRPIEEFLARHIGVSFTEIRDRLGVGRLYSLRCALVHDGALNVTPEELNQTVAKVLRIVQCVLSAMCGIPYHDELAQWLKVA